MDDRKVIVAIERILNQIGMPHNLKGYHYIVSAIKKCIEDRKILNCVTKVLYVEIAKENNDTVSRVERAIRHAIEVTWQRGNLDFTFQLFGYSVDNRKGKPTNSEFIALICDYIKLNYKDLINVGEECEADGDEEHLVTVNDTILKVMNKVQEVLEQIGFSNTSQLNIGFNGDISGVFSLDDEMVLHIGFVECGKEKTISCR